MSTEGFSQAGIPKELADEIKTFMKREPWLGMRSLSTFATDACRTRLLELMGVVERREIQARDDEREE